MKRVFFAILFLLSANFLKSQRVDSLITLKNNPFLNDLIQKPYIPDAVEINNPYAGIKEYDMVGSLGLRILKMDSTTYLHFNSSGILYKLIQKSDSSLLFKRLDKTNNFKYNIDAFLFAHQGKIFNLGGYGFWRTTGTLRCYNDKNKEWDVVPTNEEIHIPIKNSLTSYYPNKSMLYIPFQQIRNDGIRENKKMASFDKHVYALNLATNDWERLGETDPQLIKILFESPWHMPTEDGLLFSHNNIVYHLRYLSNEVHIFNKSSSLSQSLERIYFDHYRYYANGTMYYLDKKTGEYDSLSIPLNEFVKSNIKIWKKSHSIYLYGMIPIMAIIAFFAIKRHKKQENTTATKLSAAIVTPSETLDRPYRQPNIVPVIRFSETEKQLLHLLLEKSKQKKTTTITEINYVLGIKDKNISLQKKVRSEVMNSINEKFSFLYPNQNSLIGNTRSLEDKRYFEYYIDESNFTFIEAILTEET